MTDHVILRHSKLKSLGEIGGSLNHTYRLIDTPNADLNRADLNEHDFNKKTDVLEALKNRIDQRVSKRPDNVLCVEYLVTASPTWAGWGTEKETEFFDIQKNRLIEKWGAENVISTHIHRDETTPHLIAYIVPFDEEKKALNCKKWLGNRTLLQEEQTDAAQKVEHLGLTRGIKHSKAEHRTIKQHYEIVNQINEVNEFSPSIDNLSSSRLLESKKDYAKRVIDEVLPDYKKSKIEALQVLHTEKEVKALREIAKKAEPYLNAVDSIPTYRIKDLNNFINEATKNINNYEREKENKLIEEYNKKMELINENKNRVEYFYDYYNSELKNKVDNEKLLKKEYSKTQKWLEKNNLTDEEISSGWCSNGSKLYIDLPDFYMDNWKYNNKMKEINKKLKDNVYKKYEQDNVDEAISFLKNNEKQTNNSLDGVMHFAHEFAHEFNKSKLIEKARQEHDLREKARIEALHRARDEQIRKGKEEYMQLKKAEIEAYRANESTLRNSSNKKELSRNDDNDFSM